jgi:hypothetical protein
MSDDEILAKGCEQAVERGGLGVVRNVNTCDVGCSGLAAWLYGCPP